MNVRQQILQLLAKADEPMTPGQIRATLKLEAQPASNALFVLKKAEHVEVTEGENARLSTYTITETGKAAALADAPPPKARQASREAAREACTEARGASREGVAQGAGDDDGRVRGGAHGVHRRSGAAAHRGRARRSTAVDRTAAYRGRRRHPACRVRTPA